MSGHFALTAPVLGRPVRPEPRPVHFALPGPLLDDFAGFGSLLAHRARTGGCEVLSAELVHEEGFDADLECGSVLAVGATSPARVVTRSGGCTVTTDWEWRWPS